jgi:sugar lactone lactonase YvrE
MKRNLITTAFALAALGCSAQTVSTYAGSNDTLYGAAEPREQANLWQPDGTALDSKGNMYISDYGQNYIFMIQASDNKMYARAGSGYDKPGFKDGLGIGNNNISGGGNVVAGPDDNIYFIDQDNYAIRELVKFTSVGQQTTLSTLAGGGTADGTGFGDNGYLEGVGTAARFRNLGGIAISKDGSYLLVADLGNSCIRKISLNASDRGTTSLFAGQSEQSGNKDGQALGDATFAVVMGLFVDGDDVYVVDYDRIRLISGGQVSTVVPNTMLSRPTSVVKLGNFLYIADGCMIKKYDLTSHQMTNYAGSATCGYQDGVGTTAMFNGIAGLTLSTKDSMIYVSDYNNHRIRSVEVHGATTPVGIREQNHKTISFSVYPNPARQYAIVHTNMADRGNLSLMDITGKEIFSRDLNLNNVGTYQLDLSGQKAGVYLLRISTESGVQTQRLVIE